jgi:hypothetical protein
MRRSNPVIPGPACALFVVAGLDHIGPGRDTGVIGGLTINQKMDRRVARLLTAGPGAVCRSRSP